MAKVSYGPVVSDASGKVAGTVFSKWRTRSYIRRLVRPANPQTAPQVAIREAFSLQTARFLRATSDMALAWLSYAAGKPITDRSAFIGKTVEEVRQGDPFIFTPHDPAVFPVINLVVTPGDGQLALAWDNDILPDTGKTIVWWVNNTDAELTIHSQEELVNAVSSTITGLTNAKLYDVGVTKVDTEATPDAFSLATIDQDTPAA